MKHAIQTEIEINASPERVLDILLDFKHYPEWNSFVTDISGTAAVGERLAITIQPPGGKAMTFKPTVLAAAPQKELRWLGKLGISHVFDGEHAFVIEQTGNGHVRFRHSECFSGLLVPLVWNSMAESTEAGFTLMNAALKSRAEASRE